MAHPARVLSLVRRQDRRDRFLRWNAGKGFDFRFFDAIDGRALDRGALAAQGLIEGADTKLRDAAIATALSCRALWQECVAGGAPLVAFEDDGFVHGDLSRCLPDALAALAAGWDMVYFGFNLDAVVSILPLPGKWAQFFLDRGGPPFERFAADFAAAPLAPATRLMPVRSVWGMPGYAISPRGAAALLDIVFPLKFGPEVRMYGENRTIDAWALDGWITAALQAEKIRAQIFFPPLVVTPNDAAESDVVAKKEAAATPARAPAASGDALRVGGATSASLGFDWPPR